MAMDRWEELPRAFEAPVDARAARQGRRSERVLRQLERRVVEVEQLRAQLETERCRADEVTLQLGSLHTEYQALMATKTMRALRGPRRVYALLRRSSR